MEIFYTAKFEREYHKLALELKYIAEEKEEIFRRNPFDPRLKTHKLKGRFKEFWSFSITYKYRIVFEFAEGQIVYFHSIGDHDVYQ